MATAPIDPACEAGTDECGFCGAAHPEAVRNPRNHGLHNHGGTIIGAPKAEVLPRGVPCPCPNCGCSTLSQVTVQLEDTRAGPGPADGLYVGCPACPWASPMMVVRVSVEQDA